MKRLTSAIRSNWLLTLILAGYLALAMGFSVANPIYESTDELHHFRYVRYIQEFHALPEQRFDQPRIQAHHPPLYYLIAALATAFIPPDRPALYEPVHNPYYGYRYWEINNDNKNQYLHGPDEQWPYSGVVLMVHVARWVNIVIGAIMVWVTYRLALTVFPDRTSLAASAAAIVAFNPQFLFMSGAVNNDVIAGLFGSILLWQGVTMIRFGLTTRRSVFLALAFALALMAKFNLIVALPLIEAALLITVWPQRDWRGFVKANLILLAFTALIAGWWFVRNYQLYGEPTGVQRMNELWGGRDPKKSFWLAVSEIPYAWSSLWGRFGYGQIPLPDTIYVGALVVSIIGLLGLVLVLGRDFRERHGGPTEKPRIGEHLGRSVAKSKDAAEQSPLAQGELASHPTTSQRTDAAPLGTLAILAPHAAAHGCSAGVTERGILSFDRIQIKQLVLVIFSALLFAAALFGYMMTSTAGPMGRFYFPGLSAFGVLLSIGLTQWLSIMQDAAPQGRFAGRKRQFVLRFTFHVSRFTPSIISVAAFALALIAFLGYFLPAYAAPPKVAPASIPRPLAVNFDGKIELVGAEVDRVSAQPDDPIKITLYWRALQSPDRSYVEFVHLIDEQGIIVAQRDTWPGRGMYPTVLWQPGEVIADTLDVYVPGGAYAPNEATLKVGLYEQDGPRLPAIDAQGQPIEEDAAPLGPLAIEPRAGDYPNSMQVNFGNQVDLLGYQMAPQTRSILPGESITVTLYWRSRAPFVEDYTVFLNALRPTQRISAQDSSKPLHGTLSTVDWLPGQVIADVRVLRFPPTAKPGLLDVEVGWFLPKVGRLSVLAADGRGVDSRQLLSKIRIRDD